MKGKEVMEEVTESKQIVFPGEIIDLKNLKPRNGIYKDSSNQYRSYYFGIVQQGEDFIDIVPFQGSYFPRKNDKVIGKIIDIGPSTWTIDIKSPYLTMMHMNDTPWKTVSGDIKKFLDVGDYVYAKVIMINEIKESWVSIKEPGLGLRKLEGGHIVYIPAPKVPRIIGKNGSMINMVKEATGTRIVIGQNGLIWIDGAPENIIKAVEAIKYIESEAHRTGLTDRVKERLNIKDEGENNGNTQ
ncbi:exosome complex RNA-binding protein Rrp4 [Caldiplasma sukawensis]